MLRRLKTLVKQRLRRFILSVMHDEIDNFVVIADQVRVYHASYERERESYYERTRDPWALKKRFEAANVPVENAQIDITDFERWRQGFRSLDRSYRGSIGYVEKCLEHYLAFTWLRISREDIYIDVAAAGSIWADLLRKRGITAYRLDQAYPPGIRGHRIGADAANVKLPDGFASAISLQCAFETFRGCADTGFVREAGRILNERGRLAIVPLYTDETYFIMSSPYANLSGIELDPGAQRVWREGEAKESFSRHYSPEAFAERIYSQIDGMKGKIVHFTNLDQLRARYPGQSIYCHFMFYCEK